MTHSFSWDYFAWAVAFGGLSALSLVLGALLGLSWRPKKRTIALFTAFGFGYLGIAQYWLYTIQFARWFPAAARFGEHASLSARLADRAGMRDLLLQTLAGNFVHIPFAFFPAFYVTQEVVNHGSGASPRRALERYRENAWDDLVAAWQIWIPGHLIFFSTPLWARLPTNHAMSFGFCCVLSFMRGAEGT